MLSVNMISGDGDSDDGVEHTISVVWNINSYNTTEPNKENLRYGIKVINPRYYRDHNRSTTWISINDECTKIEYCFRLLKMSDYSIYSYIG